METATESASNIYNDPMEEFLAGANKREEVKDEAPGDTTEQSEEQGEAIDGDPDTEQEQGSEDNQENQESEKEPVTFDLDSLDAEKQLAIFNKVTGLNVATIEEAKKYTNVFNEFPTLQKKMELYPTLVERLKKQQDVLSYFPDETAYKVAQLAKKEEYKGKEGALTKLLRDDITKMTSMDVVKLYAELNAPEGVRNPFRYTIKSLGLDPEEVINNFDELGEDEQDMFTGFAAKSRKDLAAIGKDIEIPQSADEDIERMISEQLSASKDDLEKKRRDISPYTMELVSGVTEIKVADDYAFKVTLSDEEKKNFSGFLNDAILSGDFNVSTDEGKQELYDALMDEIWLARKQDIIKSMKTHYRSSLEKEFRQKYNNETPLDKKTPPNPTKTKTNPNVDAIEKMVMERL